MTADPPADREAEPRTEAGKRLAADLRRVYEVGCDDAIRAIEEEAARLVSPADREGLPDEAAVNEWPGGGGRVSSLGSSYPEEANRWIADDAGAWVVLYAPRSQYDGLRRLGLAGQREDASLDAAWRARGPVRRHLMRAGWFRDEAQAQREADRLILTVLTGDRFDVDEDHLTPEQRALHATLRESKP